MVQHYRPKAKKEHIVYVAILKPKILSTIHLWTSFVSYVIMRSCHKNILIVDAFTQFLLIVKQREELVNKLS